MVLLVRTNGHTEGADPEAPVALPEFFRGFQLMGPVIVSVTSGW